MQFALHHDDAAMVGVVVAVGHGGPGGGIGDSRAGGGRLGHRPTAGARRDGHRQKDGRAAHPAGTAGVGGIATGMGPLRRLFPGLVPGLDLRQRREVVDDRRRHFFRARHAVHLARRPR